MTVFTCVHLVGCLWVIIANLYDNSETTWIYNAGVVDSDNLTIYLASVYWAFSTMLTVGYGDIRAYSTGEQVISLFWMMIGGMFYTFAIGNLSSMLSNLDTR
jgi:hyperpolarization activated cyclic nucleotide-gated potassium channel 1